MQTIRRWLRSIKSYDMFGKAITLTMHQDDTYKTFFGGLVTFLLKIFFLLFIIYSFQQLFTNRNFTSEKFDVDLGSSKGYLILNEKIFNFAIMFDVPAINNWTNPFVNISFLHVTQFRNETSLYKIKEAVNLKPCNKSDFPGLEIEFQSLGLAQGLCLMPNTNLTIQGDFQENVYSYFQISLSPCADLNICQSNDTIYNMATSLSKLRLQFFIANTNIDEKNYEYPFSKHIVSDLHFLVDIIRPYYKTADIFINEVNMNTEVGYIPTLFSKLEKLKTFIFSNEFREQSLLSSEQNLSQRKIADFYFRKSPTMFLYLRSLGDVLQIISFVAGSWSSIFICLMFFFHSYNGNYFIISLANELYNFPSQKRKFKEKEIPKIGSEQSFNQRTGFSQKLLDNIKEYLSYSKKLKISFGRMITYMFTSLFWCSCNEDEKITLFQKSEENLMRELDICNILKKLQEFDKLKEVLFNSDQQIVLSFTPKPDILTYNLKRMKKMSTSMKLFTQSMKKNDRFLTDRVVYSTLLQFENLIYAWKNLKVSNHREVLPINKNLINMFDGNIRKIIEIPEKDFNYMIRREFNNNNLLNEWIPETDNIFSSKEKEKDKTTITPKVSEELDTNKNFRLNTEEHFTKDNILITQNSMNEIIVSNRNENFNDHGIDAFKEISKKNQKLTKQDLGNMQNSNDLKQENKKLKKRGKIKKNEEIKKDENAEIGVVNDILYNNILEINKNIGGICQFEIDKK